MTPAALLSMGVACSPALKALLFMLTTLLGLLATAMTSLCYIPQVRKAMPVTHDLSLRTLLGLVIGLGLWASGLVKQDYVIVVANSPGFAPVATRIGFKLRDPR